MVFSVLGAVLIVMGLYAVLWGKYKEYKENKIETIPEPIKSCGEHGHTLAIIDDIEANNHTQMQKIESETNKPAIIISVPIPKQSMTTMETQKA